MSFINSILSIDTEAYSTELPLMGSIISYFKKYSKFTLVNKNKLKFENYSKLTKSNIIRFNKLRIPSVYCKWSPNLV